ncbi:MAG: excinuclease ABC subunit UvrC [Wenzhouxiangellaceae bacterium]
MSTEDQRGARRRSDAFDGRAAARRLPTAPGVYLMRDGEGRALYVGKARNLRKRVSSYFDRRDQPPRIALMVAKVRDIEVSITRTEAEALLLENEWIKALKPRYNINLRDDKSYPWIRLSAHRYPRISFYRGARTGQGEFFGPYSSAAAVRETLDQIHRLFRVRPCPDSVFANRSRPCLQYQIKRCSAPCVGLIETDRYAADVEAARAFLRGENDAVADYLAGRMEEAARALDFETAALYRDRIRAVRSVQSGQFVTDAADELDLLALAREGDLAAVQVVEYRDGRNIGARIFHPSNIDPAMSDAELMAAFVGQYYIHRRPPREIIAWPAPSEGALLAEALARRRGQAVRLASEVRGARRKWRDLAEGNARDALRRRRQERDQVGRELEALTEFLNLPSVPRRIECFDISHISGTGTVASCVVFAEGRMQRSAYRSFHVEGITPGDDYAAMAQALSRRYRKALEQAPETMPDLILIDGGRGQSDRARVVLAELGLADIPVVGIAKGPARRAGFETWVMDDREAVPGPRHPASLLAQRIRDEAHRFALKGHRKRRKRNSLDSPLERIPGIGPKRRQRLLAHFGGLKGVQAAGIEELERVEGIHRRLAETIYRELRR